LFAHAPQIPTPHFVINSIELNIFSLDAYCFSISTTASIICGGPQLKNTNFSPFNSSSRVFSISVTNPFVPTLPSFVEIKSGENLSYLAQKYDVDVDEIAKVNNIKNVASLSIGDNLIIPGGNKIITTSNVTKKTTPNYNAISVVKNIVNPKASAPSNKMFWPTEGHIITQYYTWSHHGLDVANKLGTPLYAADAGTIEFVGWSNGYGNNIIINHGGGKKTRYAHLHKFYVKSGQRVDRGQTIGEMGSTGWSTGPHLHFEVIINNQRYNPLNYIK